MVLKTTATVLTELTVLTWEDGFNAFATMLLSLSAVNCSMSAGQSGND